GSAAERPVVVTRGADGHSYRASLSGDGRLVAFESNANSLSAEDDDRVRNVYVRDMSSGRVTLVSRATGGRGAAADDASYGAAISANGRYVAFVSRADNLDPRTAGPDWRRITGVFVRDLRLRITTFAGLGRNPSLSADGRYLAYAADPGPAAPNDPLQIVRRDMRDGTTVLVSRAGGADGPPGDSSSFVPSMSADGNRVAFESFADNLDDAGDLGEVHRVFVRDIGRATTSRVSRGSGPEGEPGDGASLDPKISGDGRFVVFWSTSNFDPALPQWDDHVWVRDLATERLVLADRASGARGAAGDESAGQTAISHDGRFVAFESGADNLAPGPRDDGADVFVRDMHRQATARLSLVRRRFALRPAISADGRYVAFESPGKDGTRHILRVRR
nr:hypothetical protein [Actinomycetota bacterium]